MTDAETLSGYIAQAAIKLPGVAELGETPGPLVALSNMVGEARIVAIGESFHHTHEQLALREHLLRHLITQVGFNAILLEVLTPGPNPIEAFVRGGAGDAESALIAAGARMWRNQEAASLVRWVRTHNDANANATVSVRGLDVLAVGPLMRAVSAQTRPADMERIEAWSYGFDVDGRSDQASYNQLAEHERAALHRVYDEALETLTESDALYEAALTVRNALKMLQAGASGWTKGFALRDRAMAEAAIRFIDRTDAKVIVLSHNTHIAARASSTSPTHLPMGAFLRARYGDNYFVLGAAFGRAMFDPPIYGVGALDGEPNSADQAIAALGCHAALVDLREASQAQPLRLQGVGIGPLPYMEYPALNAFDALAYVDVLTNARQLVDTELSLDAKAVDATRR